MNRCLLVLVLVTGTLACEPEIRFSESLRARIQAPPATTFSASGAGFLSWTGALDVIRTGQCVDYEGLSSDLEGSFLHARTLSRFRAANPDEIGHPDDRAAFWINAYNVAVFDGMRAQKSEERSAVSNGGFAVLRTPSLEVSGVHLAPDWIHHGVLRGDFRHIGLAGTPPETLEFIRAQNAHFNGWFDPRIHFALACGAASCPRLGPSAFRGSRLNAQLDAAVSRFLDNEVIGLGPDAVSSIFHWYPDDFSRDGGPSMFLARYAGDRPIAVNQILEFDWRTLLADPSDPRCVAPTEDNTVDVTVPPSDGPPPVCETGTSRPCGPIATVGICQPGTESCVDGAWSTCENAIEAQMETCNGLDDNCDGEIDNGIDEVPTDVCPTDGVCQESEVVCRSGGWACLHPETFEADERTCDGLDNDCDGMIDEGVSPPPEFGACAGLGECSSGLAVCDGNGWSCQYDVTVEQGQETRCDGLDNDCDATIDENLQQCACIDGEIRPCGTDTGTCSAGVQRCNQGRWSGCDGTEPEAETCDGLDNDCNGEVDDGVLNACGQCGPAPSELCDQQDNDCDGQIDEGVMNTCGACGAAPVEVCNGLDDDCDGLYDEGLLNACGGCGELTTERCNGLDDDCDGTVDENLAPPADIECLQLGVCAGHGVPGCTGANGFGCLYPENYEATETSCDFRDNDCDGQVDEHLLNSCDFCGPDPFESCNHLDDDCDGQEDEGCPVDPNSLPTRD